MIYFIFNKKNYKKRRIKIEEKKVTNLYISQSHNQLIELKETCTGKYLNLFSLVRHGRLINSCFFFTSVNIE